jgi:hypothetical protein
MKRTIDDLPVVRVSALVAHGHISRGAVTALVRFVTMASYTRAACG